MRTSLIVLTLVLATSSAPGAQLRRPLDIYFIDVEGGQATLLVTPSGQSMLIDTGFPGFEDRDVNRVLGTIKQAGLAKLDYLLVTHHHADHVGNAAAIAAKIPVGTFIDHGPTVETTADATALYGGYAKAIAKSRHLVVKPGDKIPLRDLDVTIVASNGEHIARPLAGVSAEANPLCSAFKPRTPDPSENARSVGAIISFGRFRMADLGDLTWNKEQELVCPTNLLGTVDLYVVTHHGTDSSNAPVIVQALKPRVAIMDNGAKKGGSAEAWQTVHDSPGLEDLWQLHFAEAGGKDHNVAEPMIANPDEQTAFPLKVSAQSDGTFTVTNARNKLTKTYQPRGADGRGPGR